MTLEGPRVIDRLINPTDVDMGASPAPAFPATINGKDWEILENVATPTYVSRSYFDLSGYNQDFLTAFFQGVDIQEGWGPRGTCDFFVVDLLTTEFLDNETLTNAFIYTTATGDLPGFTQSTYDMSQVVYGRTREYVAATSNTIANQYSVSTWGTCGAATADKLYVTRLIYVDTSASQADKVHIPPANYVVAIVVAKEDELPFLMRQKRSYELART
jgi:hypothetical protein